MESISHNLPQSPKWSCGRLWEIKCGRLWEIKSRCRSGPKGPEGRRFILSRHGCVRLWTVYGYRVGLGLYWFGSSMYSNRDCDAVAPLALTGSFRPANGPRPHSGRRFAARCRLHQRSTPLQLSWPRSSASACSARSGCASLRSALT